MLNNHGNDFIFLPIICHPNDWMKIQHRRTDKIIIMWFDLHIRHYPNICSCFVHCSLLRNAKILLSNCFVNHKWRHQFKFSFKVPAKSPIGENPHTTKIAVYDNWKFMDRHSVHTWNPFPSKRGSFHQHRNVDQIQNLPSVGKFSLNVALTSDSRTCSGSVCKVKEENQWKELWPQICKFYTGRSCRANCCCCR